MAWNWQQLGWPHFTWNPARIAAAEARFLVGSGVFTGSVSHLQRGEQDSVKVEALTTEAMTTSAIEGELLNRESVQSSVKRLFGLATDRARVEPREQGIASMMVDLYRRSDGPLDEDVLFDWHRMVCNGRGDLDVVGGYRTHSEPMRVVSGRIDDPNVHFEAPPSSEVGREMAQYIEWFNRTAPSNTKNGAAGPLPALTRTGIAHLYFESIHPFEDGNGRIGRAIAELSLAQHLHRPSLTAVAATILRHQRAYYDELEAANKGLEITRWLAWFAGIVLEAQRRTTAQVEFLIQKTRLLDDMRGKLNERQMRVLTRVLREGLDGFKGGLSAANYTSIARTPPATTTRDLADMVEKGALTRTGERKSARYHLPFPMPKVPVVVINESGEVVEA
jgi:Fic family protein